MAKKQKRDNAYYVEQLKLHHPVVHADHLAGKYASVRQALIAAGLKAPRTQEQILLSAWAKASNTERKRFLSAVAPANSSVGTPTGRSAFYSNWSLEPWAITKMQRIMAARRMEMGDLMKELGFKPLNASIGMALNRGSRIRNPALAAAIEKWHVTDAPSNSRP